MLGECTYISSNRTFRSGHLCFLLQDPNPVEHGVSCDHIDETWSFTEALLISDLTLESKRYTKNNNVVNYVIVSFPLFLSHSIRLPSPRFCLRGLIQISALSWLVELRRIVSTTMCYGRKFVGGFI